MTKPYGSMSGATMRKRIFQEQAGFTAAEIITVVAIISILALIVIPKYWSRTEEARIARAKEEMARMSDAENLVFADTGYYVPLGNLQSAIGSDPAVGVGMTIVTTWNTNLWQSRNAFDQIDWLNRGVFSIQTIKTWKGPYITYQKTEIHETTYEPLDPWKNSYFFYGPTNIYDNRILTWSMGPDLVFEATSNLTTGTIGSSTSGTDDIVYVR